jgi:hypothetical protein
MTPEQLVTAEAVKMRDARRMAAQLRAEAHDEGNDRIGSAVEPRSRPPRDISSDTVDSWSPVPARRPRDRARASS